MVHGKNRNPYWIDRRLNDLAGPEYHAIISFGLPFEPEDSQYGESRLMLVRRRRPVSYTRGTWNEGRANHVDRLPSSG